MQPKETPESLWQVFASTGRVNDYLRYRHQTEITEEASYGDAFEHPGSDHPGEQQYR